MFDASLQGKATPPDPAQCQFRAAWKKMYSRRAPTPLPPDSPTCAARWVGSDSTRPSKRSRFGEDVDTSSQTTMDSEAATANAIASSDEMRKKVDGISCCYSMSGGLCTHHPSKFKLGIPIGTYATQYKYSHCRATHDRRCAVGSPPHTRASHQPMAHVKPQHNITRER